jgi:hypothetical protein
VAIKGGLGPKSLRCNRIYKGHKDIAKKDAHCFEIASIPRKMYLKSLAIHGKASISLEKSSKNLAVFKKASHL